MHFSSPKLNLKNVPNGADLSQLTQVSAMMASRKREADVYCKAPIRAIVPDNEAASGGAVNEPRSKRRSLKCWTLGSARFAVAAAYMA